MANASVPEFENWQQDRIEHLKRLLQIYYRNLNYIEEQIALHFPTPPIDLLNQRNELNEAIAATKSELAGWNQYIDIILPTPPTRLELDPTLWLYEREKLINLIELENLNWTEPVYLGRAHDCPILIRQECVQVSRHHAQLFKVEDAYLLKDNHSRFGTYVNGVELDDEQGKILVDGDRIVLGSLGHEGLGSRRACVLVFHTG